ncbi:MAG: helix-turn-helix domain-containing protein, partial [Candidatus Heimdallarchaeota archaeon]
KIGVYQSGKVMKHIRCEQGLAKNIISDKLNISRELLYAYEENRATPPLDVILKFIEYFSSNNYMTFLDKWSLIYFKISNHITKLPLSPSSLLFDYMSKLYPRKNNYISFNKIDLPRIEEILSYFEIPQKVSIKYTRFSNFILNNFLRTFGDYK